MQAELLLTYECDPDIEFRVYRLNEELKFFIKSGAAGLELDKGRFMLLLDLLDAVCDDPDFQKEMSPLL